MCSGHDRVVTIKSRNFSIAKVWCCNGYIDLPGVVIWQHIHPSTLHSSWEESWQDSSFLGLCPSTSGHLGASDVFCNHKYGNETREQQSGHQSSYWLWTSVVNFSDLTLHPTPLQTHRINWEASWTDCSLYSDHEKYWKSLK